MTTHRDHLHNSFVGRESAMRALDSSATAQLTTVVGPPGVGKTRLVDEWAQRNRDRSKSYRIALAPLSTREEIGLAIAEAPRDALLILDNAEHLIAELRDVWTTWRAESEGARALVTSRIRLDLPEETVVRLAPLEAREAEALWRARMRERIGKDPAMGHAASALLSRLEGLPLAIEVVVSRLSTYSPDDLLSHFDLVLEATVPDAHTDEPRSLSEALAASWRLLSSGDRRALASASLTAGGFDMPYVEATFAEDPEKARRHLASLREHSLLTFDGDRIDILESVREFTSTAIDAETKRAAQESLVKHFAERFERALDDASADAVARIRQERANGLRALALATVLRMPELGAPIVQRFSNPRITDGMPAAVVAEVQRWLEQVAAEPRLQIIAHETLNEGHKRAGEIPLAFAHAASMRALAEAVGDRGAIMRADLRVATLSAECGRLSGIAPMLSTLADEFDHRGEVRIAAEARTNLGFVGIELGDHALALESFQRVTVEQTPAFERSFAHVGLAITLAQLGRDDEARAELALAPSNDETSLTIFAACLRARLSMRRGDAESALEIIDGGVAAADRAHRPWVRILSRVVRTEILVELGARSAETELGWIEAAMERLSVRGRVSSYVPRLRLGYASSHGTLAEVRAAHRRCLERDPDGGVIADLHLTLAALRSQPSQTELTSAERALAELRAANDRTVEHRATLTTLERVFADAAAPFLLEQPVIVHAGGTYFQRGRRVDLTSHPKPARLLSALAWDQRHGGGGLTYEELAAAGWEGERISETARRNRFDVSLSRLRALGLRELLVTDRGRYRLDTTTWWIITGGNEALIEARDGSPRP